MAFIFIFLAIILAVASSFFYYGNKGKNISSEQARIIAYKAIGEFKEYDNSIPPAVELKNQIYFVTFALPKDALRERFHSDYAIQVLIGARSGNVIKILAAQ